MVLRVYYNEENGALGRFYCGIIFQHLHDVQNVSIKWHSFINLQKPFHTGWSQSQEYW